MADDDLQQRFAALSVAELRRKVDTAIACVREMRRAVAVHAGMTLEQAPGPIPELCPAQAERAFQEIIEMLPLRREPLRPEERAKLSPPSAREREQLKEVLEEMAADPEAFDEAAEEQGLAVSSVELIEMRDGMIKSDMLGEVQKEVEAFHAELLAYRQRQVEVVDALKSALAARRGQS